MLRRLLIPVLLLSGLGSVVFLYNYPGTRDSPGREGTRPAESIGTPGRETTWAQELGSSPGRESLVSLGRQLAAKPREEAIAAIEEFLGSV